MHPAVDTAHPAQGTVRITAMIDGRPVVAVVVVGMRRKDAATGSAAASGRIQPMAGEGARAPDGKTLSALNRAASSASA